MFHVHQHDVHQLTLIASLTVAERALQSACGPEREIKVFAEQDDINLEYCDREDADKDCALQFEGRPVRHVRLDARVAVIDEIKRKEQTLRKTVSMKKVSYTHRLDMTYHTTLDTPNNLILLSNEVPRGRGTLVHLVK